ncbi:unnamed protein product [[Actinomadura] parvosata subsp. kistnae]|nr:unnamed protein product [Actinomadura parvosata subsp. kistnae]
MVTACVSPVSVNDRDGAAVPTRTDDLLRRLKHPWAIKAIAARSSSGEFWISSV